MNENNISPSHLTLQRKRQFMEANIPVDILVNGFLAYQLKNGETATINILTNETISLQAGMMMNKTPALSITEDEREKNIFEIKHVISNAVYFIGLALAIIATILIFSTNHIVYMVLVAPPAALLLYFKFIRKDQYLRVHKIRKES